MIELYIPALQRLPPGETFHVLSRGRPTHLGYEEYDVAYPALVQLTPLLGGSTANFETLSSLHRYAWPAEAATSWPASPA